MMKITVLGCGAVGQLWLGYLQAKGHTVQGWQRIAEAAPVRFTLQPPSKPDSASSQERQYQVPCNDPHHLASSDCLLVTLKAGAVAPALLPLLDKLSASCAIVLLHNGMGSLSEPQLAQIQQPLLQGITSHGALRYATHSVRHTGYGETHLGALNAAGQTRLDAITDALNAALPPVTAHTDIRPRLWHKLAVNCAINPLTALQQCRNGALLSQQAELQALCGETAAVMNAEGIAVSAEQLLAGVNQVIQATAENFSSMHQDITLQRASEIDYITGYLIRRAQAHGLAVPHHQALYAAIKQLESAHAKR
ncbi:MULTISPECIES: 2-dehydropantoate 2-reductase [Plesiomonas]|uniref:2-dehydropantoate 2-reductase n=1 Tax=Plesiomonas TaxID=702 RepID=UPI001E46CECC|nr:MULTISPECIES: 2-dehydropantoate 2-reductase [Plesiomonas]MCE5162967.1 2-dehydropantoate 2-reductase [Plesiomonas sp. PI-19]